jgi:hypothetical protein
MTRPEQPEQIQRGRAAPIQPTADDRRKGTESQNLLRGVLANLSSIGSPDCVLPDASGKFFARI